MYTTWIAATDASNASILRLVSEGCKRDTSGNVLKI
jgi:hypothetical protein